jgi:hypothetical protein
VEAKQGKYGVKLLIRKAGAISEYRRLPNVNFRRLHINHHPATPIYSSTLEREIEQAEVEAGEGGDAELASTDSYHGVRQKPPMRRKGDLRSI